MFKKVTDLSLENKRYDDILYIPYSKSEEELMRSIYDILSQPHVKKRLTIIVDNLDEEFLSTLLSSVGAIKSLGFSNVSFEAHIYQDVNIDALEELTRKYHVPIKIKYYLSSSDDTLRSRLESDIKIRIDPDLVNLCTYQQSILDDKELSKNFKRSNRNLFVGEIVYELVRDVNASLFECALLQYYAKRYNLAVTLLGSDELVNLWCNEISKYSPDIVILNRNNENKKNKVLSKKAG